MTMRPDDTPYPLEDEPALMLSASPERRLIRHEGSARHVAFHVRVRQPTVRRERMPIRLALVLDRSGSMASGKLEMAKQAATLVLGQLDERDTVAVVAFDDQIDLLGMARGLTAEMRSHLRSAVSELQPRGSTALHEGWLTGCNAIVDDASFADGTLARCFLLTDGLANVGVTDVEQIATDAAGLRSRAGIGTSTFGIGADYDEALLGPMALAGGGQFYHLRTGSEIVSTFSGELQDLLATAAARVRLELRATRGVEADMVSQYALQRANDGPSWVADIGDLIGGEERDVVVRFHFPRRGGPETCEVQGRACWIEDGQERTTDWQSLSFPYADTAACNAERADPWVMHWVGMHHADRARLEAAALSKRGRLEDARRLANLVAGKIAGYAGTDSDLLRAAQELRAMAVEVAEAPMPSLSAKEATYRAYHSRSSRPDHR